MATQQVNLYSPLISNIKRWTEQSRVDCVVVATGCTDDEAREYLIAEGEHQLNPGLPKLTLVVRNTAVRPIQVGSHYHFYEANAALRFPREAARGFRLNIPAGTAVRFEAGDTKQVELVALTGLREVWGLNAKINGKL